MDEMWARLLFLTIGLVIGWALGMLHTMVRYSKRTRDNTEYCRAVIEGRANPAVLKHPPVEPLSMNPFAKSPDPLKDERNRDERGATNMTSVAAILALGVVLLSLFFSISASNDLANSAKQRDSENACTSQVLFDTVAAINERTSNSSATADANLELQQAQLKFLTALSSTKPGDTLPVEGYVRALTNFIEVTGNQKATASANPYPTQQTYADCLNAARE